MKIYALRQIIFSILVGFLLVSCTETPSKPMSTDLIGIPEFFTKNVILATGIDFDTGKPLVLNPITGELQQPCESEILVINTNKNTQKGLRQQRLLGKTSPYKANAPTRPSDCNTQIVDPNQELANAISNSEKIIYGTIRKNGKDIPARFVVSVTALYEGSDCATYIQNGKQYTFCSTTQGKCDSVSPILSIFPGGYAESNIDSYRRAVRKVCRKFPTWKTSDCQYLKTRYKTAPLSTIYSTRYKQYIWKTCKGINPSWGTCPAPVSTDKTISECVNPIETP